MVKVCTGRVDWACISATTVDESTPPDRNAPSGTSAIIWAPTASLSKASSASTACAGVPANGVARPAVHCCAADQYLCSTGSGRAAETVSRQPGSSLAIPR